MVIENGDFVIRFHCAWITKFDDRLENIAGKGENAGDLYP